MLVSVIIPAYNEEENIVKIISEIEKVFDTNADKKYEYDILFVDDGSVDQTVNILEEATIDCPRVSYISFSRNFGKEAAMLAGLRNEIGRASCRERV